MSEAIGNIILRARLDSPKKTHYGPKDTINGHVAFIFEPSRKLLTETSGEFFGPLQITITLHGRAKTKIWKSNGQTTNIYRGRIPLFTIWKVIHDAPFKTLPNVQHSFPFEINFPEKSQEGITGWWNPDPRFQAQPGLPPSFSENYHGFVNRYECFIAYRLGVNASVPGLKVNVSNGGEDMEPYVLYERPRQPSPTQGRLAQGVGITSVSNEFLIPESERPSGFSQRAKAKALSAFTVDHYPTYAFEWRFTGPRCIHLHEPIKFEISIRPRATKATVIPDVVLTSCDLQIKAKTVVRAEKVWVSTPEGSGETTVLIVRGALDDKGPFSKATDWTKTVNLGRLPAVPSTFSTLNISRTYSAKLNMVFTLTGKRKEISQGFDLVILPAQQSTNATAGPSSSGATASSSVNGITDDAMNMNDMTSALPAYEEPPDYAADVKTST